MNYIRHLNAFFNQVKKDDRLSAVHVSLYLALFQYWNFNRFQNPFPVYRDNIMQLSRIGSKNTYHKCMKALHQFGYIQYHAAPSKYLPVKISILRIDVKTNNESFKQLDLFSATSIPITRIDTSLSTREVLGQKAHVSNMTGTSLKAETQQVPDMGQNIKHTNILKNSVSNTPTTNQSLDNEEKEKPPPIQVSILRHIPGIDDVEQFFKEQFQSTHEAHKFFYYNQSKNWMLTDKIPVYDWRALAHKWMLNEKQDNTNLPANFDRDIQYIYTRYLQGEKVNKLLLPEYADHLQLQLSESILQQAWQRRINLLSGSNESYEVKLWQAYMNNETASELLIKDQRNLMALAKRLALLKYFQKLKLKGQTHVTHNT